MTSFASCDGKTESGARERSLQNQTTNLGFASAIVAAAGLDVNKENFYNGNEQIRSDISFRLPLH